MYSIYKHAVADDKIDEIFVWVHGKHNIKNLNIVFGFCSKNILDGLVRTTNAYWIENANILNCR